ncbi:MAG: nicotinamide riboside transporter PnuC [Gammaproteobacteria bacterium]
MTEIISSIAESIRAMWPWEAIAMFFLVAYLLLAIRQNILCWVAALIGTAIYAVLMYRVNLYMESALQLFYIAMAVYGWYSWRHGPGPSDELLITDWPVAFNLLPITLIAVLSVISGFLLSASTDAAFPYIDSFTTWGGVVTTWMVARKILQNWYYWLVIDVVSIFLYASRGLWLTVILFMLYVVLVFFGLKAWKRSLSELR